MAAALTWLSIRSGVHSKHAIAARREFGVMGDQNKRRAAFLMAAEQKLDNVASCGLVEIAGRFVGDDDGGIGGERTRKRDALLLAAGKRGGIVMQARAQADRGKLALGACQRVGRAGEFERDCDVFQRRHGRDQMERLKDDADGAAAKTRQLIFIEPAQILAGDRNRSRVGPLQAGHHHEQRRLAGAGRTEEADRLAPTYIDGQCRAGYGRGRRRGRATG